MFSTELQKLIEASLTDGVLTDKEREVIRKRALLEGIDPDEVDLLLDSELQKLQQKQEAAVKKVKKCPCCGEIIPTIAVKCSACGYEFRNQEANSVVERFAKGISAALPNMNGSGESKKADFIKSFVIPNNADDLYEMIIYLTNALKADEGDDRKVKSALQQKLNECTDKVKMLYPDDKRFTNLLTVTKLNFWQKLSSKNKKYFIIFVLCVFWFVVSLIAALVEKINEPPSYDEVKQETKDKIHDAISDDDLEEATLLLQKVDKYCQDDYVDQYQNLLKAYIDKGDLENASSLLQGVDHMNQSEFKSQYLYVINAYISKGDIKGAEKVISGYTWSSKEDYQFFYKQIYDYYIEKGDQENAKRFTPEAVGELYDNIHNR